MPSLAGRDKCDAFSAPKMEPTMEKGTESEEFDFRMCLLVGLFSV